MNKAKAQNESLNQKHNSVHESLKVMEDKLVQQIEITSGLRGELDDIRRNQDKVDKSDVKEILARVKVAGSGYTLLLETTGKSVWHADSQIVKIQKQLYAEWKQIKQVVYENVHSEKEQLEQLLQEQETKHQQRLQKLNEIVELQNQKFKKNEEELKRAQETFDQGATAQSELLQARNQVLLMLSQLTCELISAIEQVLREHQSYEGAVTIIGQS